MNNSYQDLLHQILTEQSESQEAYDLTDVFDVFSNANIYDINNDDQLVNSFFDKLFTSIPRILEYTNNPTLNSDEIEIWRKVIRAIINSIENVPDDQLEAIRLIASVFLITNYIKADFNIWHCLNFKSPINNIIIEILTSFLNDPNLMKISLRNSGSIYENENLNRYKEGIREFNLHEIYLFMDLLVTSGILGQCFLIKQAVSFLNCFNPDTLVNIFNQQNDVLTIYYLLQGLSNDKKLDLCLKVNNPLVEIDCIREVVIKKYINETHNLTQNQIDTLSQCLIKISNHCDILWNKFLCYFNNDPSRYPLLHQPLGKALASLSDESIIEYINSININKFAYNRREIIECVNSFINNSESKDKIIFLLKLIFEKWNNFMDVSINSHLKTFDIVYTDFFDCVLAYIIHELNTYELADLIRYTLEKLNSINSEWFQSKVDQVSYFHLLLSKLYVYSTAWQQCDYKLQPDSGLSNEIDQFTQNRYLLQRQNLNKETINLINEIREKFSL
ncbi:MAG: hypothetical protein ACK5WC_17000 [Aphanizomenon sp.]|jgi:hypothetical protein|nr:hypothetical protein [Aphanizomenon flos-aquae CP01]OBQ27544.1 MAG: hypothetical protein AN483_20080 [Aphanizomenon flos-aquae MDT14a]